MMTLENLERSLMDSSMGEMNGHYYDEQEQPSQSEAQGVDLDRSSNMTGTALSYVFLFGLIFGLSATVEIKNLKKQLQNKFAISTGVAMQFIIMPVLGFIALTALKGQPGWTKEMGIALLVVTSSPGGSYSNWWCSLFNADLALSVAMTTVSSLLSMAMLPLNLFFYTFLAYGTSEEESVVQALDFGTIFMALGVVLAAISSGLYAGYRYDSKEFHVMANRMGSCCGILLVLFSLLISSGADGAENNFWNQQWPFYVGVAFPCLVGMVVANLISRSVRLEHPETVAIAIECCYQNTGIATSVAIAMYDNDNELRAQAVAVPLFYGFVEAVAILVYCVVAWKSGWTKAPASDPLCRVLANTYELVEDEKKVPISDAPNRDEEDLCDSTTMVDDETLPIDRNDQLASHIDDSQSDVVEVAITFRKYSAAPQTPSEVPFWKRGFWPSSKTHANAETTMETRQIPSGSNLSWHATRLANPELPSLHEDDCNGSSDDLQVEAIRDRSFTVDTTASSGPPTTPASRRELELVDLPVLPDLPVPFTPIITMRQPPSCRLVHGEIPEV